MPVRGMASNDIPRSYLGSLVPAESDFAAIAKLRGDAFCKQSLGIRLLLSSPTTRQRMHSVAPALSKRLLPVVERRLHAHAPQHGVLRSAWLPLDIDTSIMDNRGTVKEGVECTYTGVACSCPLTA